MTDAAERGAWPGLPPEWSMGPEQSPGVSAAQYWNGIAEAWAKQNDKGGIGPHWENGPALALLDVLRPIAQSYRGEAVALEVGCGAGRMTALVAAEFKTIVACDIAPEMIRQARLHAPAANVRYETRDLRGETGLPGGHFDVVFGLQVMPVLGTDELLGVLREVRRLLKHDGVAAFTFFDLRHELPRFVTLSRQYRAAQVVPTVRPHFRARDEIAAIAADAGLEATAVDNPHSLVVLFRADRHLEATCKALIPRR